MDLNGVWLHWNLYVMRMHGVPVERLMPGTAQMMAVQAWLIENVASLGQDNPLDLSILISGGKETN
jgi:hypothetical protein